LPYCEYVVIKTNGKLREVWKNSQKYKDVANGPKTWIILAAKTLCQLTSKVTQIGLMAHEVI
jgi:hypothetical protein